MASPFDAPEDVEHSDMLASKTSGKGGSFQRPVALATTVQYSQSQIQAHAMPHFPAAQPPSTATSLTEGTKSGQASPVSGRKMPRLQAVVRRIGSTLAGTMGTHQGKERLKQGKDFLKAYLKKFDADEVEVLRKVYKELSARSPGPGIDKTTFLQYFPLPGLWGERLFQRFDYKCCGYVDYEEFLVGIAVCCRGTKCERIRVLFQVFDLNGDGVLQRQELIAMLSNLPYFDRYVTKGLTKIETNTCSTDRSFIEPSRLLSNSRGSLNFSSEHFFNDPKEKKLDIDDQSFMENSISVEPIALTTFLEKKLKRFDGNESRSRAASCSSLVNKDLIIQEMKVHDSEEPFHINYRPELHFDDIEEIDYCKNQNESLSSNDSSQYDDLDDYSSDEEDDHEILNQNNNQSEYKEIDQYSELIVPVDPMLSICQDVQNESNSTTTGTGLTNKITSIIDSGSTTPNKSSDRKRDLVKSSMTSHHDLKVEDKTQSTIDVEAFVDKIIEECEFSDTDSLTFMEFKTWLEKNDLILNMFTDCLHEEAWGLQGNALYRRTTATTGRSGRRQKRFNLMHRHVGNEDRTKRGVVEIRPDSFYKVKRLFTVPARSTMRTLSSLKTPTAGTTSASTISPGTTSISGPSSYCLLSHLAAKPSIPLSGNRLLNSPPSSIVQYDTDEFMPTKSDVPESLDVLDVEIYPKQTRDVLATQLLDLIAASHPDVDMTQLEGRWSSPGEILACPVCRSLLVVCPRCHRRCLTIRLKKGTVVIECSSCIENAPHDFHSCWHCSWSFSEAPEWVDQCEPLYEGALYKIGRHTHNWRTRYFVLVDNLLYYYGSKDDAKPKGFLFLEGCFVEPIPSSGSRYNDTSSGSPIDSEISLAPIGQQVTTTASLMRLIGNTGSNTGKFGFSIFHGGGKVPRRDLYASTEEEREAWITALRTVTNQQIIEKAYHLGSVVGQGKFSVVHQAVTIDTSEEAAIKVIDKNKITEHERELLRSEIAILRLLHHPHVISLREVVDSQKSIYIVMEYVKGGELYELLQQRRRLPELHVNKIIFQLLSTVAYLHKCGIIHRDLKPENILLTDKSIEVDIKITDFGLSCICGMDEVVTQPCGTLAYVAPEVLTLNGYNHKVDLWSVGVIMYLLLRGRLPFPVGRVAGVTKSSSIYNTLTFKGPVWDNVCSSAKDLLRKLLHVNPSKRISAQEALQHLWIKNPTAVISEGTEEPDSATHSQQAIPSIPKNEQCNENMTSTSLKNTPSDHLQPILLDVSASTFSMPPVNSAVSGSPPSSITSHPSGIQIPHSIVEG